MTTATSDVAICNLALDALNAEPINGSISNPLTTTEKQCARHYDVARRRVLRNYAWNFAKKRVLIGRVGGPEGEYADKYELPVDCVRVLKVLDASFYEFLDFDIAGRNILCDNSGGASVAIRYVGDIVDVNDFDSNFVTIFSLHLALDLAPLVVAQTKKIAEIERRLEIEEVKGVTVDGQEKPLKNVVKRPVRSRRHFGSRRRLVTKWY